MNLRRVYARLSFWYHFSFEEIDRLPMAAIDAYLGELPGLLAEWRLQMMEATSLPHLKDGARRRAVNQTRQLAYGADEERAPIKADPRMLALLGIGVQVVRS